MVVIFKVGFFLVNFMVMINIKIWVEKLIIMVVRMIVWGKGLVYCMGLEEIFVFIMGVVILVWVVMR